MRMINFRLIAAAAGLWIFSSRGWAAQSALDDLAALAGPAAASLPAAPTPKAKSVADDLEEGDPDMFPGLQQVLADDGFSRKPKLGDLAGVWKLDQEFYDFPRPWGFPNGRLFLSPAPGGGFRGRALGLLEENLREGPFPTELTDRALSFTIKDGSGRHRRDYLCRILREDERDMLCRGESEVRDSDGTLRRYTAYFVFEKRGEAIGFSSGSAPAGSRSVRR